MAATQVYVPKKGFFLDEDNLNAELGQVMPPERDVDWEEFLEKMRTATPTVVAAIQKKILDVHKEREAYQLFGVLTPEECEFLISATEAIGYQKLYGYASTYRSNTRRIIYYDALKEILWTRVKDLLTPSLPHKSLTEQRWRAYGLNPQFRFCRYEPGQKFAPHYDGNYQISSENKSFYTFMIYLNGGFDGGATHFLADSASPPRGRVLEALPPQAGMLLVFQHNIYHEGEELRSGLKYMMRSDVMYQLDAIPASNEVEVIASRQVIEAQELLALAEQFEAQGRHAEAIAHYKKAYKLAPQLQGNEQATESHGIADSKLPSPPSEAPPAPSESASSSN